MSLRYYVLGGVAFLCVFYFSREMRDLVFSREMRDLVSSRDGREMQDHLPSHPSWQPESLAASPRYVASPPVPEAKRVLQRWNRYSSPRLTGGDVLQRWNRYSSPRLTGGDVLHEKTALEEWIQSRLTQQGLKEMTEADHWQSEQARVL